MIHWPEHSFELPREPPLQLEYLSIPATIMWCCIIHFTWKNLSLCICIYLLFIFFFRWRSNDARLHIAYRCRFTCSRKCGVFLSVYGWKFLNIGPSKRNQFRNRPHSRPHSPTYDRIVCQQYSICMHIFCIQIVKKGSWKSMKLRAYIARECRCGAYGLASPTHYVKIKC